ncbi:AAA family ATPase [Bacteroides sp.]|uniref:AAA family ATPase n=1 Tax=Bacteroides sp. TaxID=29523 RepID=UPI0026340B1F|nr:AAA family ATPase [Bacteroides sp.]MDD3039703.1 AAA family ATPase [Bacteroides sp.]
MKALAIKYRPKTFDDVVEQGEIKTILQEQLATGTQKNCYLFTGGAGTGKTTCARIFANELNKGQGNPIEIDAASNNGVENVREIIDGAKFKAIDSKFKIYILDECFHRDTQILYPDRSKAIKDVAIGDTVLNLTGKGTVKNVFKNLISLDRLCIITLTDGSHMLTTIDHLFFTKDGWVEAKLLNKGELLYERFDLPSLRSAICKSDKEKDLFQRVYEETDSDNRTPDNADSTRETATSREQFSDAKKQSDELPRNYSEDDRNQNSERNIRQSEIQSRRERELYSTANKAVPGLTECLGVRICSSYKSTEGTWVPNIIQSRPCLSRNEVGDRGGWEKPQVEKEHIKRFEENGFADRVGVESVTLYERGNPNRLFDSYLTDTERDSGYIELYDLEVSDHSSYYANGVLVHNCHMLSTGAWNAMLKIIEEPPAQTIFIFCTTDPQKIPATILSRVQRYDFRRITFDSVVERLRFICKHEAVTYQVNALEYISKIADGGMRDAITLLDKCISYDPEITVENVTTALGTVDYDTFIDLTNHILDCKADKALLLIEDVYRRGLDLKQFMKQYQQFLLDLAKYCLFGDFKFLQMPDTYAKQLTELRDFKFIKYLLGETIKLNNTLKWDTTPKALIEASLIMLCQED